MYLHIDVTFPIRQWLYYVTLLILLFTVINSCIIGVSFNHTLNVGFLSIVQFYFLFYHLLNEFPFLLSTSKILEEFFVTKFAHDCWSSIYHKYFDTYMEKRWKITHHVLYKGHWCSMHLHVMNLFNQNFSRFLSQIIFALACNIDHVITWCEND